MGFEEEIRIAKKLGFEEEIKKIQFLAIGPWKEVLINYDKKLENFGKKTRNQIKERWNELLQKNPTAFKGSLGSLKSFESKEGILYVSLQRTRFDFYYGTRTQNSRPIDLTHRPLNKEFSLPISFGAVTVTIDGYIPVGLRNPIGVAITGNMATTLPSGYFDPETQVIYIGDPKRKDTCPSLMTLIITELKEELGTEFFSEIQILGLVQDCVKSQQPLIAGRLTLPITKEELQRRAESIKVETEKLLFLENKSEAIRRFNIPWSPHDIGKLVLHFAL